MDPLPHRFAARNALQRIKPPDAGSLLRPIMNFRLVVGRGAGVAQPLCFRQIGFAVVEPTLGLLAFININRQPVPLDDPPLSVAQRLTAGMVPTILPIRRPTQAVHSLVRSSGLNCVIETFCSFWKVGRMHECLPTTTLKILELHAAVVQNALSDMGRFTIRPRCPEKG